MPDKNEQSTLNIYQRINRVRETASYLKKEKTVDNKYNVVTHDQVTSEVREDLIKFGIVIEPYMVEGKTVQDTLMFTKMKQPIIRFESVWDVHFINVDNPTERATIRVPAHALDTGDKAPGKSCSYAVKMAILKMFNVVTGEDDEDRFEKKHRGAGGLTEAERKSWEEKIDKLAGKDVKAINEAAQLLWEMIHVACEDAAAPESGTQLRARLTNKVSELKKALAPKDKK